MASTRAPIPSASIPRVILGSALGTMIEWYDFYIFGSLTTVLSQKFYPPGNDTFALIAYLATFAVGFLVRPLGALFFGRLGDLVGRRIAFILTLTIMGFSTASIGLLPTFHTAGWFAAFPAKVRYTSVSLPYHIGNGVFGGLLPLIGLGLCATTGNIYAGLYYPIGVAALTFICGTIFLKETHGTLIWNEASKMAKSS
ncbi:MAG: MFS transporter [Terracidiphilus sp.]|jgi:MFS family permease